MALDNNLVWLDWPAPETVRACYTLRGQNEGETAKGSSQPPYHYFNLGAHVGDAPEAVAENRQALIDVIGVKDIAWLQQIHGTSVVDAQVALGCEADASVTRKTGWACCVMTADCLPVFFCDQQGQQVAVAHAGWRGLQAGILQQTLKQFHQPEQVLAYLGPAIGPDAFEVGANVRDAFLSNPANEGLALAECFRAGGLSSDNNKWLGNLYELARRLLQQAGVQHIYGGDRCTFTEVEHFFSYRRDGVTGRMANLIWLQA